MAENDGMVREQIAETCDRIIELQKYEWAMTEEIELKVIEKERDRPLAKVNYIR